MAGIIDVAIEFLRIDPSSEQQYVWSSNAEEALSTMIDLLFEHPGYTRAGVEDLFRVVCALELELRSPKTADRLRTILKADPRVMEICDVAARSTELRTAHTHWAGTEELKEAPVYGNDAPTGTVTAASLVDPLSRQRLVLERPDRNLDRAPVAKRPPIARPRNRRA